MRPVPEYDPKAWLLKALRETAHAMEALVWELNEDDLGVQPGDGEWSVRELMLHMKEMEQRFALRLDHVARLDDPRIEAFDADAIEATRPHTDAGSYDLLDEFAARRQQVVYLLWSLGESDWERSGIHPYLGPLTILQLAREMNEHDLNHLWQLRRVCDRFAASTTA